MNNAIAILALITASIGIAYVLTHTFTGKKYVYYGHILLKKGLAS